MAENKGAGLIAEMSRFGVIGGGFALLYIVIATMFMEKTSLSVWLGSFLAYLLLILPAYWAQKVVAFRSQAKNLVAFPRYVGLQLASAIAAALSATLFATFAGSPSVVTSSVAAIIAVSVNYLLLKYWVFA